MTKINSHDLPVIAAKIAAGVPDIQIAEDYNVNRVQIWRKKNTPQMQEMIEKEREGFLQCLPKARKNIEKGINEYEMLAEDGKERERAWKASMEVLRGAGMLPAKETSQAINQYISMQHTQVIAPAILQLLTSQGSSDSDIIDLSEESEEP